LSYIPTELSWFFLPMAMHFGKKIIVSIMRRDDKRFYSIVNLGPNKFLIPSIGCTIPRLDDGSHLGQSQRKLGHE
jgi:hypothetical protein